MRYRTEMVTEVYEETSGDLLGTVRQFHKSGGTFFWPTRTDGKRVSPTIPTSSPGWGDRMAAVRALVLSYGDGLE